MTKKEINQAFNEWIEDDNVIEFNDGFGTQDACYTNRLKDKKELLKYFIKEFIND